MITMGKHWAVGAAMTAAALLAGGCSDDAPAPSAPSSAASSTATAESPSLTTPALPVEARARDDVGATAFVGHWFDLLSNAYATGDPASLEAASSPECGTCGSLVEEIRNVTAAGNTYSGGAITVVAAVAPPLQEGLTPRVDARIQQEEISVLRADGTTVDVTPADPGVTLSVYLEWSADRWRLLGLAPDETGGE